MPIPPFGSPPTPDATTAKKGKVKLAGVLAGTADLPALASSVALPGNPTTTTQASGDTSTRIATDAFVATAIADAISGVNPAVSVAAATTSAADTAGLTYNNGVSGVGATLTGPANTPITFDGVTFTTLGQRALVKNDTQSPSGAFNGVYYVTQIQTAVLPAVFTRALDYNQPSDINSTGAIPVIGGTTQADTSWLLTSSVTTVGTDPLTYIQFTLNPTTIITTSTAAGGDLAGTYPNPTLGAIIAPGSVGSATLIPVLTYDSKGRITAVSTATPSASTQRTFSFFN